MTKWLLGAAGIVILNGVLAFMARDQLVSGSALVVLAVTFGGGVVVLILVVNLAFEPIEWLDRKTPDCATLRQALERVRNAFLFDIVEIVLARMMEAMGSHLSEFAREHPDRTPEQFNTFWQTLKGEVARGMVNPMSREAFEDLSLAMSYTDVISGIEAVEPIARRRLRYYVYGAVLYYPLSILFAALAAPYPLTLQLGAVLVFLGVFIPVFFYLVFVLGPYANELRWWRETLETLINKDTARVKMEIERMEAPPFPTRRLRP